MDEIYENMKKYTDLLNYAYVKANTKSKRRQVASSLFRFSIMCHNKGIATEKFDWEYDDKLMYLLDNDIYFFRGNILKNKDIYLKISDSVIDSYVSTSYPLYLKDIDSYRRYHSFSDKEMLDIIISFLNDFDSTLACDFINKVNDGNLFISSIEDKNTFGETCENSVLGKNFMFVESERDGSSSIRVAASTMHEYGHDFEMSLYHKIGLVNEMYNYPFHEVSSQFMEYAFINYLIENNIYTKDALLHQRIYFDELFYFILGMNIFSEMEKVNNSEYNIDPDFMEEKQSSICERVNYYGFNKIDISKFDNAYIYGLGYLVSPYLYENYKEDPKYFMKEFKNALLTYPYTNSIDSFEGVGVTSDILIKGDVLKRVLKNIR